MNIIVNIDKNTLANKQPKIYDLGEVTTSIQDLLDNSTITITNDRLVILRFIDLDLSVKQGFLILNDYSEGDKYGLGQEVLESDLIYFTSGGSGDLRPYKVYSALLTQTGTNAPVATILENTLGGDIVWTRDTTGQYTGTLNGAFTENKTFITTQFTAILTPPSGGDIFGILGERNDNDSIHLITFNIPSTDTGDGILNETPIEIRVYN